MQNRAIPVSDLLAYKTFVADDVILLRDGTLMSAYRLNGVDFDTATVEHRENVTLAVNTAIRQVADDNLCFTLSRCACPPSNTRRRRISPKKSRFSSTRNGGCISTARETALKRSSTCFSAVCTRTRRSRTSFRGVGITEEGPAGKRPARIP